MGWGSIFNVCGAMLSAYAIYLTCDHIGGQSHTAAQLLSCTVYRQAAAEQKIFG